MKSVNPTTGGVLAIFELHSAADVEVRVQRAVEASRAWRGKSFAQRARVVMRAAELLEGERESFGRLMTQEMGKPIIAAMEESAKCATACRYYAEHAERHLANREIATNDQKSLVAFQPLGVVLAIMP
ncbi:MAG: aldehyde dehydrogenase family protein, partial [Gemmatimonadota bacterium]|nr:aldehyde dehydrogenase family protein [Gemmatimonadota bacterium]